MRIAFDLDDTLIPAMTDFPVAPQPFLARLFGHEPLREGAIPLMKSLARQGWEVWIYTTSFRSPHYIKRLFWLYGVHLGDVVNQERHNRVIQRGFPTGPSCSKYPPAFGINLLVDESFGVRLESQRFGFEMVLVQPDDPTWAAAVEAKARSMSGRDRA